MATHTLTVFQTSSSYYTNGSGAVSGSDTLVVTDDDAELHQSTATDTGSAQTFDFGSEPAVQSYEVSYLDHAQIDGTGPTFELYCMTVTFTGGATKYYVLSKDAGFAPTPGQSLAITSYDAFTTTDYADFPPPVCLTTGTRVACPEGPRLAEALRPGDHVMTRDHGAQPVRSVLMRAHGAQALRRSAHLRPVLVRSHTVLGAHRPVLVSQQHRVLLRLVDRASEVFVSARHLTRAAPHLARIAHGKKHVCYVHLLFDRHEVIFAEGVPVESLYPGPMALLHGGRVLQQEVRQLFPGVMLSAMLGQSMQGQSMQGQSTQGQSTQGQSMPGQSKQGQSRGPPGGLARPMIKEAGLRAYLARGGRLGRVRAPPAGGGHAAATGQPLVMSGASTAFIPTT